MKSTSLFVTACLVISGCGGGGGGGAETPAAVAPVPVVASTSTFQIKQAFLNDFMRVGNTSFTVAGTTYGSAANVTFSGTGTATDSAVVATTFDGVPALQKTSTVLVTVKTDTDSTYSTTGTSTSHIKSGGGYEILGSLISGRYHLPFSPPTIPVTAKVGDAGQLVRLDHYLDTTRCCSNGSTIATYALEADTASTAILKVVSINRDFAGRLTSVGTTYTRLTPAGAFTLLYAIQDFYATTGALTSTQKLTY